MTNGTPKIIIIEDQPGVQQVYASYLSDYYTYLYATAFEALADIVNIAPDLIITDIKLPDMNGFDLIRKIRRELKINTPIIIISGGVDMGYSIKAMEFQVTEILSKPLSQKELLAAVERRLKLKR